MLLGIQLGLHKHELQSRRGEMARQGKEYEWKGKNTQPGIEYFLEQVLTPLDVQYHSDSAIVLMGNPITTF